MIDGGHGSVQVTGGRGTISMVSGRELELEHCGVPVEVRSMLFVPERDLDELGRRLYGHKEKIGVAEDEGARPSPGDNTGDRIEESDDAGQCRLHAVLGLSREHQQIHQGRPCVLANPCPDPPPTSARMSPRPAPGSAASRPIVLEEHEDEEEPDVFGDRHFYGDDDFDEEMDLGDN